jgi:hypothetical protein
LEGGNYEDGLNFELMVPGMAADFIRHSDLYSSLLISMNIEH